MNRRIAFGPAGKFWVALVGSFLAGLALVVKDGDLTMGEFVSVVIGLASAGAVYKVENEPDSTLP